MDTQFRSDCLPPYVFTLVDELKEKALAAGVDVIDLGMGNPNGATPPDIVQELIKHAQNPECHRYSPSAGISVLRQAVVDWYSSRYHVSLDPSKEVIITLGAKEGLAHLAWSLTRPQDKVWVQSPCYPIHEFGFILSDAQVVPIPLHSAAVFLKDLKARLTQDIPKMLMINFPSNPTGITVDQGFFEEIVALARYYKFWVIHDFAYADLGFDGYQPPSIMSVNGAKDCAVEVYSMSKSYHMPGWRVGVVSGNPILVAALKRLKSYVDYGMFSPIQWAAAKALMTQQEAVKAIAHEYQLRRNCLVSGLNQMGWQTNIPKASMFVWAKVPEVAQSQHSLEFAKQLVIQTGIVVSPGIGFGFYGENHVRFALIESTARIEQMLSRLKPLFNSNLGDCSIGSG